MTMRIATGSVAEIAEQAPPARSWMSAAEMERLDRLTSTSRTAQFIAGRWMARRLLNEAFGGGQEAWALSAGEDGPPIVSGPQGVFVSISHSGDRVACAVADQLVGIDVELCRPRKGLDGLIAAVTTDAERAALPALQSSAGERDEAARLLAFFQVWALKEAWLKCQGGGLFATMLGSGVQSQPADIREANALVWAENGAVVAVCASAACEALAEYAVLRGASGWRISCAGQGQRSRDFPAQ